MIKNSQIPCPQCGGKIEIDTLKLLEGKPFHCPDCNTALALSKDSKSMANNTLDKINNIKQAIDQQKKLQ